MADASPTYEKITYELDSDIAIISFDDAATMNACGIDTCTELLHAFERAGNEARCTILTGKGRGFCSGANLGPDGGSSAAFSHDGMKMDAGRGLDTHYNALIREIRHHPHPVITAVNGAAAGVGCAIALMGDMVICGASGYFLQAFRRIGLVPDGGSTYLLARTVGRVRAMEMTLLGEKILAEQALEWGLVNRIVADDNLLKTTKELAEKMASGPPLALAMTRDLVWSALDGDFNGALQAERFAQRDASRTKDFNEGVTAFLQKRKADFKGN